ncbi:MAG: hypothetical protein AABY10_00655 [Nanoarchaeota archaeon]
MKYRAKFEIDCGVSNGYGLKCPDNVERTESFSEENDQLAYQESMRMAESFSNDYLSNPNTGLTTVKLKSLREKDREVSFNECGSTVQRSMLQHILTMDTKQERV